MSYFKNLFRISHDINTSVIGEEEEDVLYSPQGGTEFNLPAIFDNNYEQVDASGEISISSNVCILHAHLSHFEDEGVSPQKGDGCSVNDVDYSIIDAREDGQGGVKLIMHKA